jgi:serine O-acetyltransferase
MKKKQKFYEKIDGYVANIAGNYKENSHIISLDLGFMPDRDAIVEIVHLLRSLLFPGYFGRLDLSSQSIHYHIGDLLDNIYVKLNRQICHALKSQTEQPAASPDELAEKADDIICRFFDKLPDIRNSLAKDVVATYDGDPSVTSTDEVVFSFPGILAISVYRLAHELYSLRVPLIPRIMTEYAHSKTGIDIHPAAIIGTPFFIDHGTGIVVGETTTIGDYVRIYQSVTLGALSPQQGQSLRGVKRHPTLEDYVVVYSGASIMGGETVIGKGSVIGSNVFLTQSVPPGSRVSLKKS